MLTLNSPVETWAHRIAAPYKLAALCAATLLLFRLTTPAPLALAAAATAALTFSFGTLFAVTALKLLRPLWPFVLIVAVWHGWIAEPAQGISVLLRLLTAVTLANLVTMSTRLSDMIATITTLASPLKRIGLPPRTMALAVALTIRFIPVMLLKLNDIRDAWRARSPRRPGWRILTPTVLAAIDDADRVAEALRARGGVG